MAENEDFGFLGAAGRRVGAKLRFARGVFVNCQLVFFVADTENNRVQEIVATVGLSRPELEPSSLPQLPAPLSRQSQRGLHLHPSASQRPSSAGPLGGSNQGGSGPSANPRREILAIDRDGPRGHTG